MKETRETFTPLILSLTLVAAMAWPFRLAPAKAMMVTKASPAFCPPGWISARRTTRNTGRNAAPVEAAPAGRQMSPVLLGLMPPCVSPTPVIFRASTTRFRAGWW